MNKRAYLIIAGAFIFFYILNYLMPLAFGDDYLYAFIWQGNPMYIPLTKDAVRVSSVQDLIISQITFYYTWSGRIINNTLSQLFVWAGKDIFNFFNAFASVLLVLEMYWCSNKGRITFNFDAAILCWLFLFFWIFSPAFPSVVFWLVGACHYLWPAVFLTGFLIPYIRKYYFFQNRITENGWFICCMFIWGIIAGCTNENSVCWVVLFLAVFCYLNRNKQVNEVWMFSGLAGLIFGYAVLMFSPGNYARLLSTHSSSWLNQDKIIENIHVFAIVLVIQFILWYFCLRSLPQIYNAFHRCSTKEKEVLKKELVLIKALCVTAMAMTAVMLFSPEFHLRSAFPGTVQLIIAIGIILRVQKEYRIDLLQQNAKRFLTYVGVIVFMVSAVVTLQHLYKHYVYSEELLSRVSALKRNGSETQVILNMEPFSKPSKKEDLLSCYHTFDSNASEDFNFWTNVAFARFYGIKGVRILDVKKENSVQENTIK